MKNQQNTEPKQRQTRLQMKSLIDHLCKSVLTVSVQGRNLLINDVPAGLPATKDEDHMALVLGQLIHTIVCHTTDDCIRINASEDGSLTTIRLRSKKITYDESFALSFKTIQLIAMQMGGVITIEPSSHNGTVLAVNFNKGTKAA